MPQPDAGFYVGLMSGTSVDSIDAVLVRFDPSNDGNPEIIAAEGYPIEDAMRKAILALCSPGPAELDRSGQLDRTLGEVFASAVTRLLESSGVKASQVTAIGSHGQTVRHRPPGTIATPFSLQIGDPNTIAAMTGITTVADFRRRDMALGGQGAPLVPAFHQAVFAAAEDRAVVNVGGMANITELSADGSVRGYDTGPGNVMLDYWIGLQQGLSYDADGAWGASGRVHPELMERLMADPYFSAPPPKSTGREAFNPAWLETGMSGLSVAAADVQATLCEVTATSIAQAVQAFSPGGEVLICGGGAHNADLLKRLRRRLPTWSVSTTDQYGIAADWVEAVAFAWLAKQTLAGLAGNCPGVTGASEETVLGGIFPAGRAR
ncbi:anhydro-N-acetylmuramic acid kinase [Biformimicrobium ophioploci]|uniref:Anhydro-N-acetylmuramic acid kinase n=1 Tax=Biformimicrobium ophioploci TaxID=3036711 RepID=A0ABQ6LUD2_9GAMM|nr:anhydro-N-acetylmuramic acid kinase [Microbulbifer sp. NKW57]GMG85682.1 anhydro-N-acetylmuramic acid kinase [Microbulbifer sp. NKW57]